MTTLKPILFNTEMVRAIQNDTKTATRRVIRPQPKSKLSYIFGGKGVGKWSYPNKNAYKSWGDEFKLPLNISDEDLKKYWTAPYHADDILYVRETFTQAAKHTFWYKADDNPLLKDILWKPSIHMPKEAARIFLRVTNVRVERLQDIITGDYRTPININKEGSILSCGFCAHHNGDCKDYISQHSPKTLTCKLIEDFTLLWNSTVKKSDLAKYGWNANPWVWVIEFERISKEEAYRT